MAAHPRTREANHASRGRNADAGGMFADLAEEALLSSPDGIATLARIDAATTEFYSERDEHVRQVTLVVLRAKGCS